MGKNKLKKLPVDTLDPAKPRSFRWHQSSRAWYYGMYRIREKSRHNVLSYTIHKMLGWKKMTLTYGMVAVVGTLHDAKKWVESTTILENQDG